MDVLKCQESDKRTDSINAEVGMHMLFSHWNPSELSWGRFHVVRRWANFAKDGLGGLWIIVSVFVAGYTLWRVYFALVDVKFLQLLLRVLICPIQSARGLLLSHILIEIDQHFFMYHFVKLLRKWAYPTSTKNHQILPQRASFERVIPSLIVVVSTRRGI